MQTVAELKQLFRQHNLFPSKGLGQHFLVDPHVNVRFLSALALTPGIRVVEIGPGFGALTGALLKAGALVTAVERDRRLAHALKDRWGWHKSLTILREDFLKLDWAGLGDGPFVIAGNLPYVITSPVLDRLVQHHRQVLRAVLTMQHEVAQRVAADPGSKSFGALTVFVQAHFVPELVATISPKAFYPQPGVTSAILTLTPRQPPLIAPEELASLIAITQALFQRRRKTVLNGLLNPALSLTRVEGLALLAAAVISPEARPETIEVSGFVRLSRQFRQTRGGFS